MSNPHVACSRVLVEQLCVAIGGLGLHTLMVDASEHAAARDDAATPDLSERLEHLSPRLSYLDARGTALHYIDSDGSAVGFLEAVVDAAPCADVVLMHAAASDLVRMFGRRPFGVDAPRAVILCDEQPEAIIHAYAGLKLLASHAGMVVHDLLLSAVTQSQEAALVAARLARCANRFFGALQHRWVCIGPGDADGDVGNPALRDLVEDLLLATWTMPSAGAHSNTTSTGPSNLAAALPAFCHPPILN
ncbi:MAG: flagellar biosynthesis protein [Proteobacteria bacterium]|nr:flagellar biosynthesis protein [Pseudomonadota bacterium]